MRNDSFMNSHLLPCPLCHQRFLRDTPMEAWRALYKHLRYHHDEMHAAKLTQRVRLRIARLTWEIRRKESNRDLA